MKNYEATRAKIKNYLNALRLRYTTKDWNNYHPTNLAKEFGVSVTLPHILKKEGYIYYEHRKDSPVMMLSEKIYNINEVVLHQKSLDYSKVSYDKNIGKNNKKQKKPSHKSLTIKLEMGLYRRLLGYCANNGVTVSSFISSKLDINSINVNTKKTEVPKKMGRPLGSKTSNKLIKEGVELNNFQQKLNFKVIEPIESPDTKIKSLETIMMLYTNGVINQQEVERLKNGILTK